MSSYADRMNASKQNFEAAVASVQPQKKNPRDAGLAADIAAELLDDGRPEVAPPPIIPVGAASSIEGGVAVPSAALPAVVEATRAAKSKPKVKHQGVTFREGDLDIITDMLYHCHSRKIRLPGKKGPSIVVQAALDEIVTIFKSDPQRFETIMRRYASTD